MASHVIKAKAKAKAKPAKLTKPAKPAPKAKKSDLKTTIVDTPPRKTHGEKKVAIKAPEGPVLRGLRTVIYPVADLAAAKAFYIAITGKAPYFDQPFYVGFDINGFELGLDPDVSKIPPGKAGAVAYWRVDRIAESFKHVTGAGARTVEEPHDVGGGIQVAIVSDPFDNLFGLIEMP